MIINLIFPLEIIVITALAWQCIGWFSLLGTGFVIGMIPVQVVMGKIAGKLRRKTVVETDQRLRMLSEVIAGIRAVKMYAWEWPLRAMVNKIRRRELKFIRRNRLLMSFMQTMHLSSLSIISFILFTSLALIGGEFTPENVFSTLALYSCLKHSVLGMLSRSLLRVSEALVAIRRIQKFLEKEELLSLSDDSSAVVCDANPVAKVPFCVNPGFDAQDDLSTTSYIQLLRFKSLGSDQILLENNEIMNKDKRGSMTVPRIALRDASFNWSSNKTSALSEVSTELEGQLLVGIIGPVGSGKSALLLAMLRELSPVSGDVSLTGRITYVPQVPWVFSGSLRENVLFGSSYDEAKYWRVIRACALDEDIVEFPDGDLTLIGERGISLSGGQRARVSLARAAYRESGIYLLDDPLSAVDVKVGSHLMSKCICGLLGNSLRLLVTHHINNLEKADHVIILENGRIASQGTYSESRSSILVSDTQGGLSDSDQTKDNAPLEIHGYGCYKLQEKSGGASNQTGNANTKLTPSAGLQRAKEDRALGSLPWTMYWKYLREGGSPVVLILLAVLMISGQVIFVLSDWWLARWTDMDLIEQQNLMNVYIFAPLIGAAVIMAFARTLGTYYLLVKSSQKLHDKMVTAILKAPVLFFDTNPSGRILNRFSKDTACMDDSLPYAFLESIQGLLFITAVVILSIAINYWVLLGVLPLVGLLVFLRRYVLRSTRDMKRLEAILRSPIYSHYSATLEGLTSIRAFGAQEQFIRDLYGFLDKHTRPYVMFYAGSRWLSLRVEFMCSLFISTIAFAAVLTTADAGYTGMSLVYAVQLMGLTQWIVRVTAQTENLMTSVERVMTYASLDSEPGYALESKPPPSWPEEGSIACENLSLVYYGGGPEILKGIDVEIYAREKIGVVGRTGAGKSSIVAALFRMPQPEGKVIIDGVNIGELNLQESRKCISVIPQDPVLFSGSLRYSLDPLGTFKDITLWTALEQVKMKVKIENLQDQLDYHLSESGSNLSVGERQLVCLARALLQGTRIVVIDEATANVDMETDRLIQETIRTQFKDRTVITIAHRLDTIMDSDRVMVMRDGRVIEFDQPDKLVHQVDGEFAEMVRKNTC